MFKKLTKISNSSEAGKLGIPAGDLESGEKIVHILKDKYKVKLLAFDFDETLLDVSAMPFAEDPADLAIKHFRNCFRSIMSKALENDLACCIVSFNSDRDIISKTLEKALPNKKDAKKVLIVTSDWSNDEARDAMRRYGKQQHLELVKREFQKSTGHRLEPLEIFLFDDNEVNIRKALSSGHHCYHVDKSVDTAQILDFVLKQAKRANQTPVAPPTYKETFAPNKVDPRYLFNGYPQYYQDDFTHSHYIHQPIYAPVQQPISLPIQAYPYPKIYDPPETMNINRAFSDVNSILSFAGPSN